MRMAGGSVTVTETVAVLPPAVAVMVVVPAATPVTIPDVAPTVATPDEAVDHVTAPVAIVALN